MSAQITCFCSGYNENCFACFGSGYRNARTTTATFTTGVRVRTPSCKKRATKTETKPRPQIAEVPTSTGPVRWNGRRWCQVGDAADRKKRKKARAAKKRTHTSHKQLQEKNSRKPVYDIPRRRDRSVVIAYTVCKKIKEGDHYVYRLS